MNDQPQSETLQNLAHKFNLSALEPIPFDVSTRRYFRAPEGILMMDQDQGHEARIANFTTIAERLRAHHLCAPAIHWANPEEGFLLMEDFGSTALKDQPSEANWLKAFNLLPALREVSTENLKLYSEEIYQEELSRLWRFYLEPLGIKDQEIATLAEADLAGLAAKSTHFVHLDFHAENLMILQNGEIGLIDIQDARQGHALYDLASFLDGIRLPNPAHKRAQILAGLSTNERHDFYLLSAQRLLKIIGIFARMSAQGRDKYQALLPIAFENLALQFEYPELKLWREWFYDVVPAPTQETLQKLRPHEQN